MPIDKKDNKKDKKRTELKSKQEKSKNGFDPIQYEKPPHH
jgi:hypothetical protein